MLHMPPPVEFPVTEGARREIEFGLASNVEISLMANHCVIDYIQNVEEVIGTPIDARIKNYLSKIPRYLPLDVIFVGQNPYQPDVLPYAASALSINCLNMSEYPPSIYIMSQFIAGDGRKMSSQEVACILSNSFMLLEVGILFINVYPIDCKEYPVVIRLQSHFAELIRSICLINRRIGKKATVIHSLGDEAKKAIKLVTSSLKGSDIAPMSIRTVSYKNPVWVYRSFDGRVSNPMLATDASCRETYELAVSTNEDNIIFDGLSTGENRGHGIALEYSWRVLKIIGSAMYVRKLFFDRVANRRDMILARYVEKERAHSMLEGLLETTRQKDLQDNVASMSTYQRKQQTPTEIYMEKTVDTYRNMSSKCIEMTLQMQEQSAKIDEMYRLIKENLSAVDQVRATEFMTDIKLYATLCHKTTAFFGKIPALALSTESLCHISGSSSTPIMRSVDAQESSAPATIKFIEPSLSSLEELTKSRTDKDGTGESSKSDVNSNTTTIKASSNNVRAEISRKMKLAKQSRADATATSSNYIPSIKHSSSSAEDDQAADEQMTDGTPSFVDEELLYEEHIDTIDYESSIQAAIGMPFGLVDNRNVNQAAIASAQDPELSDKFDQSLYTGNRSGEPSRTQKSRTSSAESNTSIFPGDSASLVSMSSVTSTMSVKEKISMKLRESRIAKGTSEVGK